MCESSSLCLVNLGGCSAAKTHDAQPFRVDINSEMSRDGNAAANCSSRQQSGRVFVPEMSHAQPIS